MVNSERTVTFLQECSEDYLDHVRDLPAERCSVSTGWRMVHYHEKFISGTNLQNTGIKEDKPKKKKKNCLEELFLQCCFASSKSHDSEEAWEIC